MKKNILYFFSALILTALFSLRAYAGCAPAETYLLVLVNADPYFSSDGTVITVTVNGAVVYVGTPPDGVQTAVVDGCFPEGVSVSVDYVDAFGDGIRVNPPFFIQLGCTQEDELVADGGNINEATGTAGNIFTGTLPIDMNDLASGSTGAGTAIATTNPTINGTGCSSAAMNPTIALSPTITNNTTPPAFPSGVTSYAVCDIAGGASTGMMLSGVNTSGLTENIEVCATYVQPNVSGNETGAYIGIAAGPSEFLDSNGDNNGDGNGENDCGIGIANLIVYDAACNVISTNPTAAGVTGLTPGATYIVCGTAFGTTMFQGADGIFGTADDVMDAADGSCTLTAIGLGVQPFESACAITPDPATNIVCDDAGTPFDPSDDTFSFDVLVNGENTDGTDTFNDDQGGAGIAYGTSVTYGPFLISDGAATITFTDVDDINCTATTMATPPATCSDAMCSITPDAASNIVCDDAGTPFDDTDDTFTFDISVNGDNTDPAASDTFTDNRGNTGIAYGTVVSYGPFSISGGDITVMYTDADEASCTGMMTAAAPATCSNAMCSITPDVATNIVCDDNGTPADDTDDTFTFDILVNGDNTDPAASDTFTDNQGNTGIAYGTVVSYGSFPIAGGPITVIFTDADAPVAAACTATMMANPPATCSGATCMITPEAATNILCDDNGTPGDDTDDTYTFDITVDGNSTFPGATNTFNDDRGNAGIAYGTTVSYGPFMISGGNVTVNFTDADEATCTGMMMATAPMTCSGATCMITPTVATNIVCNDNGTDNDPTDDTYTFDITVNGSNTFPGATNTFSDDQSNAGIAYGTTVSYGPYPISGGNITVNFTDTDQAGCTAMMMAAAPATCSVVCEGAIAGSITLADCDFSSATINIFDASGALIAGAPVAVDAMGNYSLAGPFACGTYTAEIVNAPACYTNGGGDVGPREFIIDGDDTPDGFNFMGPIENIPTVSEWGLIILGLLMSIMSMVSIRQRMEEENEVWS